MTEFQSVATIFQSYDQSSSPGDELAHLFAGIDADSKFLRRLLELILTRQIFKTDSKTLIPVHKSTLYLLLYCLPDVLMNSDSTMKKVLELFGGFIVIESGLTGRSHNLLVHWETFKAAQRVLNEIDIERLSAKHHSNIQKAMSRMRSNRDENIQTSLKIIISANRSITWLCLHQMLIKTKITQPLQSMLELAKHENTVRRKFQERLQQKDQIFDQSKKKCQKYSRILQTMMSVETTDDQTTQWFTKIATKIDETQPDSCIEAKKLEKALISYVEDSHLEAPILVTIQSLIKSLTDLFDSASFTNQSLQSFDKQITSYWLVSESEKLLSRDLHDLIKNDADNVRNRYDKNTSFVVCCFLVC